MQVRLDVLVSSIARDAGLDPDRNTQDKQNIIGWVNDSRREIYELPVNFSSLQVFGEIVGVALVTAGTVAVTNAAAEVTGSGTSWTSGMSGRYISIGDSAWQRVSHVTDATHLFMESPYGGATSSGLAYKIWQKHYPLPPKAARVTRIIDPTATDNILDYYDPQEFYARYGRADSFSDPIAYTQYAQSDFGPAYLASTSYVSVSVTANSPIVDFSGTTLVGTVFPGDRIIIGNSTTSTAFVVDNVLSNTKLALKNYLSLSSSSLSATAISMDRLLVSFYPAINNTKVYTFEGVRQVHDISNNADLLERGWYSAVLKGAKAKAFGYVRDPREEMAAAEYSKEILKLIRNQIKALNPSNRLKPFIGIRYGRDYVYPSDHDNGYGYY